MFVPVPAPSAGERQQLVQRIATRIGRSLERAGLITRDIENAYLAFDPAEESPMHGLLGSSITYRIATGPREGQKVFTLQALPPEPDTPRPPRARAFRCTQVWRQRPHNAPSSSAWSAACYVRRSPPAGWR